MTCSVACSASSGPSRRRLRWSMPAESGGVAHRCGRASPASALRPRQPARRRCAMAASATPASGALRTPTTARRRRPTPARTRQAGGSCGSTTTWARPFYDYDERGQVARKKHAPAGRRAGASSPRPASRTGRTDESTRSPTRPAPAPIIATYRYDRRARLAAIDGVIDAIHRPRNRRTETRYTNGMVERVEHEPDQLRASTVPSGGVALRHVGYHHDRREPRRPRQPRRGAGVGIHVRRLVPVLTPRHRPARSADAYDAAAT